MERFGAVREDAVAGISKKWLFGFSRRGRLLLAAGLLTGFWVIAIPLGWP